MVEKINENQSGGISIGGSIGSVGGDLIGRDKIGVNFSAAELSRALRPVSELVGVASAEGHVEAEAKLAALIHGSEYSPV